VASLDRRRQFSLRCLFAATVLTAVATWSVIQVKAAVDRGDQDVVVPVFVCVMGLGLVAPLAGGWLGVKFARSLGGRTYYLGPIGVLVGLALSAGCLTLGRYLAWGFISV
jgi:hypothetical protein